MANSSGSGLEEFVKKLAMELKQGLIQDGLVNSLNPQSIDIKREGIASQGNEKLEKINDTFIKALKELTDEIKRLNGGKSAIRKDNSNESTNSTKTSDGKNEINKTYTDLNKATTQLTKASTQLNKASNHLSSISSELKNTLSSEIEAIRKTFEETRNLVDEINKSELNRLERQKYQDASDAITGGRSRNIREDQRNTKRYLDAITSVSGEDSAIGRASGRLSEMMNVSDGASAKLGYFQMAVDVACKALDFFAEELRYDAKEDALNYELRVKDLENRAARANAELDKELQVYQKEIDGQIAYAKAKTSAELKAYSGGIGVLVTSLTDITAGAYKALDVSLSKKYALMRADIEKKYTIGDGTKEGNANSQKGILQKQLEQKLNNTLNVLEADRRSYELKNANDFQKLKDERNQRYWNIGATSVGAIAGAFFGSPSAGAAMGGALSKSIFGFMNANRDYYMQLNEQSADINKRTIDVQKAYTDKVIDTNTQVASKSLDAVKSMSLEAIGTQEELTKMWAALAQEVEKTYYAQQQHANDSSVSLGFIGSQKDVYEQNLFNLAIETAGSFGKTIEDIAKLQQSFAETTGRNKILSNEDITSSFALGTLWGDDTMSALNNGMEIFNHSIKSSNELFGETNKSLLRMGLNGRKFGKDLIGNLRLAEKFDFKRGVEGLISMSKWAQNVRFNMANMDGVLSKIQDGGLEGIVKQSAGLQVLGGKFSMYSDPLAMAFESFQDPEALAKRMNEMLAGLGRLDKKGNLTMGIADNIRVKEYSKLMGIDYKDARAQIAQMVKANDIGRVLGADKRKFDEEQLSMIANKASFENGKWYVTDNNQVKKDVRELSPEDLKMIAAEENRTLEDTAKLSLSVQQSLDATTKTIMATMINDSGFFKNEAFTRMENVISEFKTNGGTHIEMVKKMASLATENQKSFLQEYKDPNNDNKINQIIKTSISSLTSEVTKITTAINTLADAIAKKNGVVSKGELDKFGGDINLKEAYDVFKKFGSFKASVAGLRDTNSAWYSDPKIVNIMNQLKANGSALMNIKDETIKRNLAYIIGQWDDSGSTTDVDFKGNKAYENYMNSINQQRRYNSDTHKHYMTTYYPGGAKGGQSIINDFIHSIPQIHDGLVSQNGEVARIDNEDQVLAAKKDGPIDRMLDTVQMHTSNIKSYSGVSTSVSGGSGKDTIDLNINGNIKLVGSNGSTDITNQITNDPTFIRNLTTLISIEVEKKANGGRVSHKLNRSLSY